MKWITRRNAHVDRTSCPWLIRKFIDQGAEFDFVAPDAELSTLEGLTFDMRGGDFSHQGVKCTFEVLLEHYHLTDDAALVELGRIIRDADVPPSRSRRREGDGLDAIIAGFQLTVLDDHDKLQITSPLYDALHAYCQNKVSTSVMNPGAPGPKLGYRKRMAQHLSTDLDESDRAEL